jgi:hypothetical protein
MGAENISRCVLEKGDEFERNPILGYKGGANSLSTPCRTQK